MVAVDSFDAKLQRYNHRLHQEPASYIAYCVFWMSFWIVATPIVLWILVLQLAQNLLRHYVWNKGGGGKILDPKTNPFVELAVVVTGCDGGFGKDLAWEASRTGFTVFAGCWNESSLEQYQLEPRIIAIKMDVTSDSDVQAVVERVGKWLNHDDDDNNNNNNNNKEEETKEDNNKDEPKKKKKRVLHALVNNAGMSVAGLIDWVDMDAFDRQMQVNYFGVVRTCKAFLPIFKDQAPPQSPHYYGQARIINMISAAGMNAVGAPLTGGYEASKNAAEAFTASLRLEMKKYWNVHVTSINPSFHQTSMASGAVNNFSNTWNKMTPELRDQYGQDFFDHLKALVSEKMLRFVWQASVVTDEMVKCLLSLDPPAQVLVGMDCRFVLATMRMIPAWARTWIWMSFDPNYVKPATMRM